MTHTIILNDDQYARLEAAGRLYQRPAEQVIADLLAGFPAQAPALTPEEYERRWTSFLRVVGSIQHGAPLSNEEIDELIGEEAAETHATTNGDSGASPTSLR